jgi:DnaK suppressor protein
LSSPEEVPGAVSKSLVEATVSKRNAKKAAKSKAQPARRKSAPRPAKGRAIAAAKPKPATKRKVAGKKMAARAKASSIVLPPDYRPSEDEPFMNERQRMYFRQKLLNWKEEIIRQTRETLAGLHEESTQHADLADRATSETDRALELRARDRQRKLIAKIDAALARIEDGSYGYCEETGEPIGLKRLDARPIATLSVEAQERHERRERVYRED